MSALLNSLTERELGLVREAEGERLADLDEDALLELHTRVRRARDRQVKIYRRQAASLVPEVGGRGKAHPRNTRNRAKAEVFGDPVVRTGRSLQPAFEVVAVQHPNVGEATFCTALLCPSVTTSPAMRGDEDERLVGRCLS